MEMEIKKIIAILSVCLMTFTALSAVMVFAPQPDGVNTPFQNVVIVNDSDNPVPVDLTDTSIDVTMNDPVNISGWLHTTETGNVGDDYVQPFYVVLANVETKGYRIIAAHFAVTHGECTFKVNFGYYPDTTSKEEIFTVTAGNAVYRTYDVIGEFLHVEVLSPDYGGTEFNYYMTT